LLDDTIKQVVYTHRLWRVNLLVERHLMMASHSVLLKLLKHVLLLLPLLIGKASMVNEADATVCYKCYKNSVA
jgi:hypothetical protein